MAMIYEPRLFYNDMVYCSGKRDAPNGLISFCYDFSRWRHFYESTTVSRQQINTADAAPKRASLIARSPGPRERADDRACAGAMPQALGGAKFLELRRRHLFRAAGKDTFDARELLG